MLNLDGKRVQTVRRNGEVIRGTASGPLPWLLPMGEYYDIRMDNPVEYSEPDDGTTTLKDRKRKRKTGVMSSFGTYRAELLTIL